MPARGKEFAQVFIDDLDRLRVEPIYACEREERQGYANVEIERHCRRLDDVVIRDEPDAEPRLDHHAICEGRVTIVADPTSGKNVLPGTPDAVACRELLAVQK